MKSIQSRIHGEQVIDKILHVDDDVTLKATDQVVHCDDTDNAIVVTLPPVAECAGKMFSIHTITGGGVNGVDVIADGSQLYATSNIGDTPTVVNLDNAVAIDTEGDFLLLFCDGFGWMVMAQNIQ